MLLSVDVEHYASKSQVCQWHNELQVVVDIMVSATCAVLTLLVKAAAFMVFFNLAAFTLFGSGP